MSKALRFALLSGLLFAAGAETGAAATEYKAPARLKNAEKELLSAIKEGGTDGIRVPDETAPEYVTLLKAGWLEINDKTKQLGEDGKTSIIARLSEAGRAKAAALRGPRGDDVVNTRPPADFKPEIEDFDLSKLPTSTRAVRAVYPFEQLTGPGKSMFYPAPADFPADKDFAATKAGTITGQNRKAKEAFDAVPAAERPPGAVAPQYKAINDTKDGVRGVRFVRVA